MKKHKKYINYKDCDLIWSNEIPEHWEILSFRNILVERNEKNSPIKSKERLSLSINKGVTLYADKTTNLDRFKDDFTNYKLAHEGDLVLNSMNMIVGAVGVSNYFGCVSPIYYTFTSGPNNCNSTKYYEYLFRSKIVQGVLFSLGRGLIAKDRGDGKYNTLRLKVSRNDLLSLKLPLPNPIEQSKIASFLDYKLALINRFIHKKKRLIKLLNERIITKIQTSSNIGNSDNPFWIGINSNWEIEKAKRIFVEISIKNHPGEELLAVTQNRGVLPKRLCEENFVMPTTGIDSQKLVELGDFVISLRSFQGGIEYSNFQGLVSPAYTIIRLKPEYQKPEIVLFYKYLFKSKQFINLLNTAISGIRDGKNVSWNDFAELPIPIPRIEDIQYLPGMVLMYETQKMIFEREEKLITEYQNSLIAEAVTGKIDVRDFEIPETKEEESYDELEEEELNMVAEDEAEYETTSDL